MRHIWGSLQGRHMIQHRAQGSPWDRGSSLTTSQLSRRTCASLSWKTAAESWSCSGPPYHTHSFSQVRWFSRAQMFLLRAKHSFSGAGSSSHLNIPPLADRPEPRSRDHSTFLGCNTVCHCRSPDILSTLPPSTKLTWHHVCSMAASNQEQIFSSGCGAARRH